MAKIEPDWTAMSSVSPVIWSTDLTGSVTWTATGGDPTSSSGAGFPWMSPATPGNYRLTASNGAETIIRDLVITDYTFAYRASLPVEGGEDDTAILHRLESGLRNGRQLVGYKKHYDLKFNNRGILEYNDAVALRRTIGRLIPFTMEDPITSAITAWYFDSPITKRFGRRGDSIDYAFKVLEA